MGTGSAAGRNGAAATKPRGRDEPAPTYHGSPYDTGTLDGNPSL
jgi:hypothetical protein